MKISMLAWPDPRSYFTPGHIAPQLGFSGYQPLIRAYIGQGLRQDLARLEGQLNVEKFINCLRKHGVDKTTIDEAISEAG